MIITIYVVCVVDICVKENKEGYVQLKEESMCVFVYVMALIGTVWEQ